MTTVSSLGVDQLSLRGSGTDYNVLSRFFATKAQADAALADSSWVPTAGKSNACITGDQGILVYDFGTTALVVADAATRAYVDSEVATAVANLIDSSPDALNTLNELAAALGDDANFATTITNSIAAVQTDVDTNEADADAAIAELEADVQSILSSLGIAENDNDMGTFTTTVLTDTTNLKAALENFGSTYETRVTAVDAAIAAVQSDVDQNETDGDAADAALSGRIAVLEADPTTATALAAVQADVDANEADSDAAEAALSGRIAVLEADPTTATAVAAVQADVDANETAANTAIALKADIASPTFTGTPAAPTAAAGTNTTQLATTAFVSTAVANVIDAAPGALDTLNELAAALGDDANFSTTITNSIAAVQADVDQNELDADTAIATKLNASAVSAFGLTLVDDADAATARTTLGVDAAGTDNSTDVTLAGSHDYLTISGQEITVEHVNLVDDITGTLTIANGGTGATTAAAARTALGLDAATVRSILGITENNGDPADGRGMYYDTGASKYLLSS